MGGELQPGSITLQLRPSRPTTTPLTVRLKTIYINSSRLGGAFVWAVKDDDANATLIKTMADGLSRHD